MCDDWSIFTKVKDYKVKQKIYETHRQTNISFLGHNNIETESSGERDLFNNIKNYRKPDKNRGVRENFMDIHRKKQQHINELLNMLCSGIG